MLFLAALTGLVCVVAAWLAVAQRPHGRSITWRLPAATAMLGILIVNLVLTDRLDLTVLVAVVMGMVLGRAMLESVDDLSFMLSKLVPVPMSSIYGVANLTASGGDDNYATVTEHARWWQWRGRVLFHRTERLDGTPIRA